MNVSRLLCVSALCKLAWRDTTPNTFTYVATCNEDGEPLFPGKVGDEFNSNAKDTDDFKKTLKAELHRRITAWERTAILELLLAAAVNVPWIVFLLLVAQDLEYDPTQR